MLDVFENEIAANGRKIYAFRNKYNEYLKEFLPGSTAVYRLARKC